MAFSIPPWVFIDDQRTANSALGLPFKSVRVPPLLLGSVFASASSFAFILNLLKIPMYEQLQIASMPSGAFA